MKLLSIPVGVSDFEEIRRNGYYYVDKSGLIGELLGTTGTKVTLITRPRRFGKTLGMSMLESFFDIQKESGTSEYTRLTALAPMKRCFFDRDTVKNAIYEKWLDVVQ